MTKKEIQNSLMFERLYKEHCERDARRSVYDSVAGVWYNPKTIDKSELHDVRRSGVAMKLLQDAKRRGELFVRVADLLTQMSDAFDELGLLQVVQREKRGKR